MYPRRVHFCARFTVWLVILLSLVGRPQPGQAETVYPVTLISAPYPGAPTSPPVPTGSYAPALSANGQYAVFFSISSRLVPNDTNNAVDIFLRDLADGVTTRVSGPDGVLPPYTISEPTLASLSADGRYVAFSGVDGLAPADDNGFFDVLVYDQVTGQYERISEASDGTPADEQSWWPSLSADGRYVAFLTMARNLVSGYPYVTNITVMLHDRQTHTTVPVTLDPWGNISGGGCPSISADGRHVVFTGDGSVYVGGGSSFNTDVLVFDIEAGIFSRASVNSSEVPGNDDSDCASISTDGRFVAFASSASNLVPGDTNNAPDVFVRDTELGTTRRVSVSSAGVQGNKRSASGRTPAISANGRFVAYASEASNLILDDTNNHCDAGSLVNCQDIFIFDTWTGQTTRVSLAADGSEPNSRSHDVVLSGDARTIVFSSDAYNLVPEDTSSDSDIYAILGPTLIFLPLLFR
jgi:Tol biopolymer transport system component